LGEGVAIAFDSCAPTKLRSGLTILGVVIGVTTVMAIASMVQGIRTQIFNAIETAVPSVFYIVRYFSSTPVNPGQPAVRGADPPHRASHRRGGGGAGPADRVHGHVGAAIPADGVPGNRTQTITIFGADDHYMDIQGGTLLRGRFFTKGS